MGSIPSKVLNIMRFTKTLLSVSMFVLIGCSSSGSDSPVIDSETETASGGSTAGTNPGTGSSSGGNGSSADNQIRVNEEAAIYDGTVVSGALSCRSADFSENSFDAPSFDAFDYPSFENLEDVAFGHALSVLDIVTGGNFFSAPTQGLSSCNYADYADDACASFPTVSSALIDGTQLSFTVTDNTDTRKYIYSDPTFSNSRVEVINSQTNETATVIVRRAPDGTEKVSLTTSTGISSTTVESPDCSGKHWSENIENSETIYSNNAVWSSAKETSITIDYTYCGEEFENGCFNGQLQ